MEILKKVSLIITLIIVVVCISIESFSQSYNGIYNTSENGKWFKMFDDSTTIVKVESVPVVSLNDFESLKKKFDKQSGEFSIMITLTEEGKTEFAKVTKERVGKKLAFIIKDILLMAPVVQQEISGGKVRITGPDKKLIDKIVKYYKDFKKNDRNINEN